MDTPPIIAAYHPTRVRDFYLRCLCAIVIGIVGFWWPEWYASRIPSELDSRVGIVFVYTLPFIIVVAFWATMAFKRAYRPAFVSAVLLLLVWSPVLIMGTRIIGIFLSIANLMLGAH